MANYMPAFGVRHLTRFANFALYSFPEVLPL